MRLRTLSFVAVLGLLASCQATSGSVESLATTRVAADRDLYSLRRIAILPVRGASMRAEDARAFEGALAAQLGAKWKAEIIPLDARDIEEVPENESFRLGRIDPEAILKLSRRYNLDGLLQTTITERRTYPPQRLGIEVELTSCETGLPIWSASLRLDGASERLQRTLHQWHAEERQSDASGEAWDLYLLSPLRFSEFAAAQVALAY